jgi:hypothetical protein
MKQNPRGRSPAREVEECRIPVLISEESIDARATTARLVEVQGRAQSALNALFPLPWLQREAPHREVGEKSCTKGAPTVRLLNANVEII